MGGDDVLQILQPMPVPVGGNDEIPGVDAGPGRGFANSIRGTGDDDLFHEPACWANKFMRACSGRYA